MVLQIEPDSDIELAKKKFKKLSLLIHPDKNPDDRDRADQAFDIIKKAMKQIENPLELNRCKDCYTEARARLAIVMSEKRRKAKKENGTNEIEEDDPEVYKKQLWITVTKVFADREKKRKMLEERANEEKRRAAETIQQAAEKRKLAEEFAKNYEESRDERSGSWRNFQAKKAKREEGGKTMRGAAFRPPKPKRRAAETIQQAAEKRKLAEEFAKNYEESRDERSGSWRNFQAKKAKREEGGKTMRGAAFRPPKPKLQK
ncbi:DnaJ domain protein [Teladorsagia circumcincta]|uniref:DnaJ domain protein n=1 Tax=Teladorsagia circumcincta TaxID=45464 RepID=A0A2G9V6C7_TELCI|nr:DnaJ domain protein [Teladorsagia circumcincta]